MAVDDAVIRITEIPLWTLAPFIAFLIGALTWVVRWILRHPGPE